MVEAAEPGAEGRTVETAGKANYGLGAMSLHAPLRQTPKVEFALGILGLALSTPSCSWEIPAATPDFEQRPRVTLFDVQDASAPAHPEAGASIYARDLVVTAVDDFDEDASGSVGTVFVQEIGGGPYSGIQIYRPTIQPAGTNLAAGDVVEIEGTYVEFELGQINPAWSDESGRTITQLTDGVIRKTGEWVAPEALPVDDPSLLAEDPTAESFEGVLVAIGAAAATSNVDSHGAFTLTGGVQVLDDLYRIPGAHTGMEFDRLAGVVSYLYAYQILPRSANDVSVVATDEESELR